MGLDMVPMGKPQPGFEKRYTQIIRIIEGSEKQELSFFDKLKGKKLLSKEDLLKEWFANQIPAYEAIKAPRVGRDQEADEWLKQKYLESDKTVSEALFIMENDGYYVVELAKELDGVPVYITMNHDRNVFRGEFMQGCIDLIGEELVAEAWNTKMADATLDYGNRLMVVADKIAEENNLQYLKSQRMPPEEATEDSIEWKLHIVYSLAKWLIFYGKNGHGYEADY